jgi:hypothetical protein
MDSEFTQDDIDAAIAQVDSDARVRALTNLSQNPDDGARALQLSRDTGVAAPIIHGDLENFEDHHRASLLNVMLADNEHLANYVRGNPLASVVSNDDYGNLNQFSLTVPAIDHIIETMVGFGKRSEAVGGAIEAGILGAGQGAYEGATSPMPDADVEAFQTAPALAKYAYGGWDLGRRALEAMSGAITMGATESVKALASGLGAGETATEQLGRDVQTLIEESMGRAGSYLEASIEPPRGVHPESDRIKTELNAAVLEKIDENLAAAQASATRERDPISFEAYAKSHYGEATLGISGDRVVELYGDRVPSPDDGLLGWVPDIGAKLDAARLSGDDVHVPLSGWVTYVDPTVAKELHDDIRVWPGGITAREAAEPIEPGVAVDSPLAEARRATGTEPLFAIGDRKLELKQLPSLAGFEEFHEYQFVDEAGRPVGQMTIVADPAKKELYVADISGLAGLYSNSFGPSLIRDLKKQLKAIYPDYETITGHRVSGARYSPNMIEEKARGLAEKAGEIWDDLTDEDKAEYLYKITSKYENLTDHPKVKLATGWESVDAGIEDFRQLLDIKAMEHFGQDIYAEMLTPGKMTPAHVELGNSVGEVLERITGGKVDYGIVGQIQWKGGWAKDIAGVYIPRTNLLLIDLFNKNPLGVAHHEVIHWLRNNKFFSDAEWAALEKAAVDGSWLDAFEINDRYKNVSSQKKIEEAIAEAFRSWSMGTSPIHGELRFSKEAVTLFEKLMQFWEQIKEHLVGKGIDPEALFQDILSGELAKREADRAEREGQPRMSQDGKIIPFKKKRLTTIEEIVKHTSSKIEEAISKVTDLRAKAQSMLDDFTQAQMSAQEEYQSTLRGNDNLSFHGDEWIDYLSEQGKNAIRSMTRLKNEAAKIEADYKAEQIAAGLPEGYRTEVHVRELDHGGDKWIELTGGEKEAKIEILRGDESIGMIQAASSLEIYDNSWFSDLLRSGKGETIDEVLGKHPGGEGPAFSIEDERARLDNLRAEVAGLDSKSFKKLNALLQERHQRDLEAAMKRAEANQKRTQTKEWKAETAELRKEVATAIRQRPDVMADQLISSGIVGDKQLEKKMYPLRAEDLTEEQRKALPRRYYSADGLPIDSVANMFGFGSGEDLIAKLVEYNKDRGSLTSKEHLDKIIDAETTRQMERKFGELDKNIMQAATDEALSETTLNLVAEEWQGVAMQHGVATIDKDLAKEEALRVFGGLRIGDVDYGRLSTQMLKHYRDATRDLIAGDPASAVVRLQRRYMIGLMAAEAKKLEKQRAVFDHTAKQFQKREVPSVEPEYTNFIQDILIRVGKPVRRSVHDLQSQIEAGESKSLAEFVANKSASLREVPVWDQLYDPAWRKNLDDLTVDEFRAVNDSVKTLVHNGRDERKIYRQGEAEDYGVVKERLIAAVADSVGREVRAPKKPGLLKSYYVNSLQMETILNRWDGFDAKGEWNQYIMRDLIDGANQEDAWKKEYAKKIKELGEPKDLNKSVDNPIFRDQDTDTTIPLTRKNLIAVMLNTGTGVGKKSNLYKLAKGYGLEPDQVMAWVHQHATKEDWEYVQGVWDMFKDIKSRADKMYRSLSGGVAPENIPTYPIATPHGEFAGGYYPVIYHSEMEGKSKKLMGRDPLEEEGFVRATTPAGYTKSRTGYTAPVALDMDQMPGRISQMLHDIALRPAIINASKVFFDHDVRSAVRKHYGDEYRDLMIPYLKGVANSANEMSKSQRTFTQFAEVFRQNVITTLVGLNPGTVLKHAPSALVTSLREVGPADFLRAVQGMFRVSEETGETNWQFAMKNSLELQRRDRNWEETIYGSQSGVLNPGDKFSPLRQRVIELSSKPVAMSDMLSAVPTWIAAYEKEMRESGVHGDAVYAADRAVRRAHGSTAVTNRTAIMREWSPWLTSVYNFFSDIMNRQMEAIWKAGEIKDLVKEGDKSAAMKSVGALTASLFAYALWPALVEHLVSGQGTDKPEPWAKEAGKAVLRTAASSWVGVRDFANWILTGYDPQFGLAGTAMKELGSVWKDLGKDHPLRKDHAGKLIQDSASFVGTLTGMVPAQVGRTGRFLFDVKSGMAHPRGPWAWMTGLRFGTTKGHSTTWENYKKGLAR